jgi:DNA-binding response OmpR family regulator
VRVLIVEDEILIAMELEETVSELGHEVVGLAADKAAALALADQGVDVALVDVNLRDGQTGVEIGQRIAREHGAAVVFVTANPGQLGGGVAGTLGVLPKPASRRALASALAYALSRRAARRQPDAQIPLPAPPADLMLFA